jgi:hypothetical protein
MAGPFEIVKDDAGQHASNGEMMVTALDPEARVFRRRAVKNAGSPEAYPVEWCVVEQDGVRVYCDGMNVVVTKQDLSP